MAQHSTPRGEASTAQGNGMKNPTPGYEGKHRQGTGMIPHGDRNRATEEKGGGHSR